MDSLSKPQFKALWAAFKRGGAVYGVATGMGGARRRMIERMAKEHLLNDCPPFPITLKGMRTLHAACKARWAKDGCMAYQDDLKEVEVALGVHAEPVINSW
jgi:hypothetical protein